MEELRLTRRLFKYWDLIRKDRDFPDMHQLNSAAIEDVCRFCVQVGVDMRKGISYKYEDMGEPIATLYGDNLTGRAIEHDAKDFPGAVVHNRIPETVEKKIPLNDEGFFVNRAGKL